MKCRTTSHFVLDERSVPFFNLALSSPGAPWTMANDLEHQSNPANGHPTPKVSVVIPAVNEALQIAAAIHSAWNAGAAQVIVVDGGSSDETPTMARQSGAQVLTSARRRSRQQNTGAFQARGEIVLFLHADCRLAPDSCQQILDRLDENPAAMVGAFRQQIDAPQWTYRVLEWGNAWRARWLRRPYGDQCLFVRKDWFTAVGGFPDVPILEEILLMRRLARSSPVLLLPGPVLVSARRWQRSGVVRQTVRNWKILAAFRWGVSLETISSWYRPHDQQPTP